MENQITWNAIGVMCEQTLDGYEDVITRVQWRCSAVSVNDGVITKYAQEEGWVDLAFDPSQPYIERSDVSEDMIIEWLWNGYIDRAAIEAEVLSKLS